VIRETLEKAKRFARGASTILLLGESGTGKELFAQAIHKASRRSNAPFVSVSCGAIPAELIQSELFGYADGAFTGAKKGGRPGKLEQANGGSIFLDEIGEMPLPMQVNLLRVLEERAVVRVGDNTMIPVDVRIIAATNRSLYEEVSRGRFREDLFYRLNVISVIIPPLRERTGDISLLPGISSTPSRLRWANTSAVSNRRYWLLWRVTAGRGMSGSLPMSSSTPSTCCRGTTCSSLTCLLICKQSSPPNQSLRMPKSSLWIRWKKGPSKTP